MCDVYRLGRESTPVMTDGGQCHMRPFKGLSSSHPPYHSVRCGRGVWLSEDQVEHGGQLSKLTKYHNW
eukprot:998762-Pelagomonas_calceolata.AAC.1